MNDLEDYIASQQKRVDHALDRWVPPESENPSHHSSRDAL